MAAGANRTGPPFLDSRCAVARDTIPGPRGKWLVGDVIAYQRDRIAWLTGNRAEFGDLVRLAPGAVVLHDAELAHDVLVSTNETYTIDSMLGFGSRQRRRNEANLTEWMRVRRGVWRSVSERVTRLHVERFATDLEADLARHAGGHVDVVAVARAMLGRAIADFCVGGSVGGSVGCVGGCVGGESERAGFQALCGAADDLFVAALRALVSGEGRVGWWPRPAARAAAAANGRLLDLLATLVRRRAGAVPEQPRDLLDALVAGVETEADVQHAVLVLRTIMFASHGVPGAAFSWIALLLAEHPDCAAKVAGEAVHVSDVSLTGGDSLARAAPYTTAFIKEALRLYPPQWLITRTSKVPIELAGHRLPANTEVLICPYLLHRDPRWWTDPERFDPDRWLGRDQPHGRHAYLPFGAGPRVCPGSLLATVQLTVLTTLLARDYRLELPPLANVRPSTDGLMLPTGVTGSWHRRVTPGRR